MTVGVCTMKERVNLDKYFRNIYQLPTLPDTYVKLRKILTNPKTSAQEVSAIIEQDQALATKVLKIVNSAFYSFPRKIATISHATVILGFNEIRNIAFSASVLNLFGKEAKDVLFDHKGFWNHALAVAVCSRIIAKKAGAAKIGNPEEAFMAGLIHDIGKITQEQFMNDLYVPVLQAVKDNNKTLFATEKEILGFEHQDVGEYLVENWNLPSVLSAPVAYHHMPHAYNKESPVYNMVALVHIANGIVRALNVGWPGDRFVPGIDPDCWKALGLGKSDIESIMNDTVTAHREISDFAVT